MLEIYNVNETEKSKERAFIKEQIMSGHFDQYKKANHSSRR